MFLDDANAEQLAALYCPSLMLWLVASRQPFPHDDASIIRLQRPRMIPPVPAPWVNRPEEAILRRLLTPPMGGPLVLVGPAGRGKTSLAAKLAHDEDLRQHYPDGILWCDLLHADLTTVLLQLADVLGFEPGNRPDPGTFASQVAERLKEGRYLLILDHADDPAAGRAFLGFGTAVMLLIAQDKQPFRSLGFVPLHLSPPVESTRSDALYLLVPSVSSDALQAVVSERMPPSVFISYSYDSDAHAARVLALADALCDHGIDVILDRYVHPAPAEGWPPWMERNLDAAQFVLMVCTATYRRRVMGEEEPDQGTGVRWEGTLIYNRIAYGEPGGIRFIPILLPGAEPTHIPDPVRGHNHYRLATFDLTDPGYEALYRHLTDQPATLRPDTGPIQILPPIPRPPAVPGPLPPSGGPWWNVPYPRNGDFTGREAILAELEASPGPRQAHGAVARDRRAGGRRQDPDGRRVRLPPPLPLPRRALGPRRHRDRSRLRLPRAGQDPGPAREGRAATATRWARPSAAGSAANRATY